jgi:hypothetical protein
MVKRRIRQQEAAVFAIFNDIGEVKKKAGINFIQKFFPLYLTRRFFQKR